MRRERITLNHRSSKSLGNHSSYIKSDFKEINLGIAKAHENDKLPPKPMKK